MSLLEVLAVAFIVIFLYYSFNHEAACVQLGDYTYGTCREFYSK